MRLIIASRCEVLQENSLARFRQGGNPGSANYDVLTEELINLASTIMMPNKTVCLSCLWTVTLN